MSEILEQQFLQLVQIVEVMQNRIQKLEQENQILIQSNKQLIEWIDDTVQEFEDYKENAPYEWADPRWKEQLFPYPDIRSGAEAIELIVNEHKSIARFGDGEFATIAGRIRHRFQNEIDEELGNKLREVLRVKQENLLIGLADNYGKLDQYNEQGKKEIRRYMKREVRREHARLLHIDWTYYDTYMTRPYLIYADHDTEAPAQRFKQLQRIWEKRDCVFIEGQYTGLGVGNDLFCNAKSIKRIIGPAENAFHAYEAILEVCRQQPKNTLFLLALGPTATVLAFALCKEGYQAVDIGHIDLEYEWFLRGEGHRIEIEGKYNNEIPNAKTPELIMDETYRSQIIAEIKPAL